MKKFFLIHLIILFFTLPVFSEAGFEFGIGSGHSFYGNSETENINDALGPGINQAVIYTDASFLLDLNEYVIFALGGDSLFDLRWKGSNHAYLIDYAFLAGFRVYPDLAGLFLSVDYALGRRSDFIKTNDYDDNDSTKWGNGFKFGIGYDFSYHMTSFAPLIAASFKSMPRGGSRDNIFCVSLKITKHK